MGDTIDGELATMTEADVLAGYAELRALIDALGPDQQQQVAKAYAKASKRRGYNEAADAAADLAYAARVAEDGDRVAGVPEAIAELHPLTGDAGHPLGGYGFDLALALLAYDELDQADFWRITEAWRVAGLGLPAITSRMPPVERTEPLPAPPAPVDPEPERRPDLFPLLPPPEARRPGEPVGARPHGPAPAAPVTPPPPRRPPAPAPPVDPVAEVLIEKAVRRRDRRSLNRWATALTVFEGPLLFGSALLAGYVTSWLPLVLGLFAMVIVAVFAVVCRAKAARA